MLKLGEVAAIIDKRVQDLTLREVLTLVCWMKNAAPDDIEALGLPADLLDKD